MINQLLGSKSIRQFCVYFLVGGTAAMVEWISFAVFEKLLHSGYVTATILSFIIATGANFVLGRKFAFKETKNSGKEALAVYFVSAIGLLLNLTFMRILVKVILIDSMISKIISTGLVFMWNFLSRKFFIYKH